jgi:serine protease Do
MTKFYANALLVLALYCCFGNVGHAQPSEALVNQLNTHVLRVQVLLANGRYGLGSGVVVAKDQVVTNCHVVANAVNVSVVSNGATFEASALKADWKHDLCMLTVVGLDTPAVNIGSSKDLQYEQSVFTVGYPSFVIRPVNTFGVVKGLYPMDDSVVIRATSSFKLGASGGGVFDDQGRLVGIITLKSPGRDAYYYNMPVEWVKALLNAPAQAITAKSELPFWALSHEQWPHFMKVVQPFMAKDWDALLKVATKWTEQEPNATEAWFYLAAAEYAKKDYQAAEDHLYKVVTMNDHHSQALYYLAMIAEVSGKHDEAMDNVAKLDTFDGETATLLKVAMKLK